MSRLDRAREANTVIRRQRSTIDETLPRMLNDGMALANGDFAKARTFVGTIGSAVDLLPIREWELNMTTAPGELVYDPDHNYAYAFSGKETMMHANSTYYPGYAGVYYWSIVPRVKNGVKVYPDISSIVVAVKQNEIWYNTTETQKFRWKGLDNANCSWPPVAGNEWEEVIDDDV